MRRNDTIIELLTLLARADRTDTPTSYLVDCAENMTINLDDADLTTLLESAVCTKKVFQRALLDLMINGYLTDSNIYLAQKIFAYLERNDYEMAFNFLGIDPLMLCETYEVNRLGNLNTEIIALNIGEALEDIA